MRKLLGSLVLVVLSLGLFSATARAADWDDGWRRPVMVDRDGDAPMRWRGREWREHERRERAFREHERRERWGRWVRARDGWRW